MVVAEDSKSLTDKEVKVNDDGTVEYKGNKFDNLADFGVKTAKSYEDQRAEFDRRGNRIKELEKTTTEYEDWRETIDKVVSGELELVDKKQNPETEAVEPFVIDDLDLNKTAKNIQTYVDKVAEGKFKDIEARFSKKDHEAQVQKGREWLTEATEKYPELAERDKIKETIDFISTIEWNRYFELNPYIAKSCGNNPVIAAVRMMAQNKQIVEQQKKQQGYTEGGSGAKTEDTGKRKLSYEEYSRLPKAKRDEYRKKEFNANLEKKALEKEQRGG